MTGSTLRSPAALAAAGLIAPGRADLLGSVADRYAVAVTPAIAALINPADLADPIGLQVLPQVAELAIQLTERADPIGDDAHSPVAGVVHRYPDRVLLKVTHACAIYCRFCFRRETVGPGGGTMSAEELDAAMGYVAAHPEIWEVILTGGDPLVLSPRRLANVADRLARIEHVKILRVHTRLPVADPDAVTDELIAALKSARQTVYVALHANHPRELTPAARAACARIIDAGVAMVSQTVLLKGVNDSAEVLETLMRAFVETRIKPYYLHHADLAPGTAHLRTTLEEGQALMRAIRGRLSGLCQPAYVLDIPGGHGKVPVGPTYLEEGGAFDPQGMRHAYPPVD